MALSAGVLSQQSVDAGRYAILEMLCESAQVDFASDFASKQPLCCMLDFESLTKGIIET
jgi:hypothetical protein